MDYKLNNHIVCGALFLGLFFLLLPLAAQGPQYFDGAEYAAAAISNSIVHQPGYPWFMLINHFLVKIFSDNPYHTIAIFSLACHILAGYLIFLSYKFLKLSSVIAVLAGTSFIFFSDALKIAPDTEVFGFHHLLISATFYLALKFYYLPNNKWRAISLGLVYGIACAHHQTSILWAPFGLALLFSKGLKTNLLALVLGATLGFSGNLLLFTVNDSWVYLAPDSIAELTHFLLRSDYGTFSLFSGQAATTFSTLPHFLFAVCTELPAFVLLLISLVISLFVKRSALSIGLTMTFVLHLWFIAQFNFPSLHPIIIEFASRFNGLFGLFIILTAAIALTNINSAKIIRLTGLISIIAIAYSLNANISASNLGSDRIVAAELNAILSELPANAIYISNSDRIGMGLYYRENINPSLGTRIFLHIALLNNPKTELALKSRYPALTSIKNLQLENILEFGIQNNIPIYVASDMTLPKTYWKHPIGVTWRVEKEGNSVAAMQIYKNLVKFCQRLPDELFTLPKERKASALVLYDNFAMPFAIFAEKYPSSAAASLFKNIANGLIQQNADLVGTNCKKAQALLTK